MAIGCMWYLKTIDFLKLHLFKIRKVINMNDTPTSVYSLPAKILKYLRIGTCSWNYPEWSDLGIYSQSAQRHYEYLPEYSKYYNTVEIDQWFWSLMDKTVARLPKQTDVKAYNDLTPDDFKFTVKAPNSITLTHFYKTKLENPDFLSIRLLEKFLKIIEPLKGKIGAIMFEFEYLNKEKMSNLAEFIEKFGNFSEGFPIDFKFAVETRNPNYLKPELFEFLKDQHTGIVLIDGYYMPPIDKVYLEFKDYLKTYNLVIIRLLGKDRAGIEKKTSKIWNNIVENRDETLEKVVMIVIEFLKMKVPIFASINNHFEGSAPLTISKIISHLSK
jgi:uncharacterized protein YecE (DUF72 family)